MFSRSVNVKDFKERFKFSFNFTFLFLLLRNVPFFKTTLNFNGILHSEIIYQSITNLKTKFFPGPGLQPWISYFPCKFAKHYTIMPNIIYT